MAFKLKNISIFWRFVVLGTVIFVILGLFLASLVAPALTRLVLQQRELTSVVFANRLANEFLMPEDFAGLEEEKEEERIRRFEEFISHLQVPGLFRVKIWNPEGVIIYSDKEELIGQRFSLTPELQQALNLETTVKLERFDPDDPRYVYEVSFGEGIESYAPITFGDSPEVVGVIETYSRAGFLLKQIGEIQELFTQRIAISLVIMFAALSFIVWKASRTVGLQKEELSKYAAGLEKMVKERTADLEEERTKLSQIAQHMKVGVILLNKQGGPVFVNREAKSILALPDRREKDVLGVLFAKFPKLNLKEYVSKCTRGKPATIPEAETEDKSIFEIAFSCLPERGKGFFGHLIWLRDITEAKMLDRTKSEFIAIASHQLRAPLSTINWYSEAILGGDMGKVPKNQKKYLEAIYNSNQRMITLISALLNVSRIELGTFIIKSLPTNLIEIVNEIVNDLLPQIKNKKLKIEKNYSKSLPMLNVDPNLIRIIFQNLLANAVNYTPRGGTISFTIKVQKPNMLIEVTDTGYGIPKHQQSKVFTKLFRADNVVEKQIDGTGLGLYIVKKIIEQSGGKIWFESEENKGTTFYVTIPLTGMKEKAGTKTLGA